MAGVTTGCCSCARRRLSSPALTCRPQNKAPQALPVDDYADRPFVDFLGGPCGLSAAVQRQLLYGVALLPDPAEGAGDGSRLQVSTREGMARLSEYVLSLGRFGSTAFIASMYGHGEVAQALCRVGAVHGGIYVLRAPVCGVVLGDGCDSATPAAAADRGAGGAAAPPTEGAAGGDAGRVEVAGAVPLLPPPRPWRVGVTCTDGSCFRGAAVLAGAPYALAPLPPGSAGDSRADAAAFLVPPPPHDTTALGVCIAIAASPLLSLAKGPTGGSTGGGDGSAAPPETLMCATVPPLLPPVRYAHTVHVLQLGHANGAAPPGHYVLYCWTHATVRAGEGGGGEDAAAAAARAAACRAAAATMQAVIACGGGAAPLWQCTYSLATPVGAGLRLGAVPGAAEEGAPWVSLRPPAAASLHDEAVTAAAEDAWARLFPGLPLWSEGARRDADAPGEGATEAEADGAAPAAAASAPGAASSTAAAAPSADPAAGPGDDFDVFAALALLREDD